MTAAASVLEALGLLFAGIGGACVILGLILILAGRAERRLQDGEPE